MKKKIHKIWGIGVVLVLVASLIFSVAPVSAGTLSWSTESVPSTTGNQLAPSGTNIVDLAISGDGTIWAAVGTTKLYKSVDGGVTWSSVTTDNNTDLVAVAPDDSNIVAYVDTSLKVVWASTNGGSSWSSLGTPQEGTKGSAAAINDIAISPDSSGIHYIAVAGEESGPLGNVWYFNLGAAAGAWTETNEKDGFGTSNTTGFATVNSTDAVAFSPNFASDLVMAVVSANATNQKAELQLFSFNTKKWNYAAAFGSDYPAKITDITSAINKASIVLAPDYLGSDDSTRVAFVGLDLTTDTTNEGIYRMKDAQAKKLKGGVAIYSVAYDGTNLVAGKADDNVVYRCADPLASSPTVSSSPTLKSPSGVNKVSVIWSGSDVIAGTSGNESAISISRDNGKNFNSISLIDTALTNLEDVAISADGSVIYLATDDGADFSLWRKASSWERVLNITGNTGYIVRMSPQSTDVVYVAKTNSQTLYYTNNGGDTKWFVRTAREKIQDLAVESDSVAYIAVKDKASVSKTTNAGFTWGSAKSTKFQGSGTCYSIVSLGEDKLIVSSTDGYVSYSTDGASSFTPIKKQLESGATNLQVTASGLSDGDFIYAASGTAGGNVGRWEIGTSTKWSDIISGTLTYGATGIALSDAGVLYVVTSNTTTAGPSELYRTLSPSTATSSTTWSTVTTSGVAFAAAPRALWLSSGSTKLWAIDQTSGDEDLYSFTDTLAEAGPTLVSPRDGATIPVNTVSGSAYSVSITWERPSKATKYDYQFALDKDFDEKLSIGTGQVSSSSSVVAYVADGSNFMPGTTYYWRVRVASDGPVYSPWSEVRSFTVEELPEPQPPVTIEPAPPAPVLTVPAPPPITLQAPEITLPEPTITLPQPTIQLPPAPAPVAPVPDWAIYAIIIIGAVLVIAVIVLIVRTRRPV